MGDISIQGESNGHCTISSLRLNDHYRWCSSTLNITDTVDMYGGVMAADGTLVNVGDYVAFRDDEYIKVQ